MKERRKDLLWEMALILLTVAACLYSTGAGNIFGAKVDWSSQHSVFPEYFRQQFYRTGQFFPEFALNIGGGQNIYNFSYYGKANRIQQKMLEKLKAEGLYKGEISGKAMGYISFKRSILS